MSTMNISLPEPPLRVMPHVLSVWGLKPMTDPSETAELDDRFVSGGHSQSAEISAHSDRFYKRNNDVGIFWRHGIHSSLQSERQQAYLAR